MTGFSHNQYVKAESFRTETQEWISVSVNKIGAWYVISTNFSTKPPENLHHH